MAFDPISAFKNITEEYREYLKTIFNIEDPEYRAILHQKLADDFLLSKGPYLDVINSFKKGKSIPELVEDGVLAPDFRFLPRLYGIPSLYAHQEEAIRKASAGDNLVITTGTGSGKTECFLIPILNELMREKEQGTLTDGIRALLIYPMNALANDQMDRLRKLLLNYPYITFGSYTGQTKEKDETTPKEKGALDLYRELNGSRLDEPRLQDPLPNERLSREAMKKRPPHILITNYAMLEYLMLRPEDNVFFSGEHAKNWKFIVLDEAHTYSGSTGIEVSALLRRLRAELNQKEIQFFLTSATLGGEEADEDIVRFARKLCSSPFSYKGIVRASRIKTTPQGELRTLGPEFYLEACSLLKQDEQEAIRAIEGRYYFHLPASNPGEYLFDLLSSDRTFWEIKNKLENPLDVTHLANSMGWSVEEIASFVDVASRACKGDVKLFDARYHGFIKAPEGAFITLAPHKDLFLTRKNAIQVGDEDYRVFEAVTCRQCHSLYLVGAIENEHLVQKAKGDADSFREAFYLGSAVNDKDEDDLLSDVDLSTKEYELCPHCGFIRPSNLVHKKSCGHDEKDFIKVIRLSSSNPRTGVIRKCIRCESVNNLGILRGLFSGQEASTSVIGTSLFEELPRQEKRVVVQPSNEEDEFGGSVEPVVQISSAKQFMAFSDSRQAAAYYASYLGTTYDEILGGRLIKETLNGVEAEKIPLPEFVQALERKLKENNIVPSDLYLDGLSSGSAPTPDYRKIAWQLVLKQLVENGNRNSLPGLGLFSFGLSDRIEFKGLPKRNLSVEEVKTIGEVFTAMILGEGAVCPPVPMNEYERSSYLFKGKEIFFLKNASDKYVRAFAPIKEGGMNKRLDYLFRVLQAKGNPDNAVKLLNSMWDNFFDSKKPGILSQIMIKDAGNRFQVNPNCIEARKGAKLYQCDKCHRVTPYNVSGVCPTLHCDGHLQELDPNAVFKDNHYFRLYQSLPIQPLRVVEHTAQLSKEEGYKYQMWFKDRKIDVLSCSTTFEMGVDVGDLQTVFMRNMPPSPSNYAQRAGRAGRSKASVAFALTFCNRANHDFHFFDYPLEMMRGDVTPPQLKTDNLKICIRHLYSCAFSYFFRACPQFFSTTKRFFESKNGDISGYEAFKGFLVSDSSGRRELQDCLRQSVPLSLREEFEIVTFGWTKWLFDQPREEYPNLDLAKKRYESEISSLQKGLMSGDGIGFRGRIRNLEQESILSFLSRNDILPKYGFPVDTVELDASVRSTDYASLSNLNLTRDLSMAITEYAPGCQVVANGKLITSRYIQQAPGKDWRLYDYSLCPKCHTLNVCVHVPKEEWGNHPLQKCKQCGEELKQSSIKTFLIPEFGFVADKEVKRPTLVKPERTYRTDVAFCSDKDSAIEETYPIGQTEVKVSYVGDEGDMVLLNSTDFFVCPKCGYAMEAPGNVPPATEALNEKHGHRNKNGYPCDGEVLQRFSLGYRFKTDILRIRIKEPLLTVETMTEEAYSILQALILSSERILGIDAGEIGGCLQYYFDGGPNFSYILYDKTPGGAGHVKVLNSQDMIQRLLTQAYRLAKDCRGCDEDSSCYGCLRTYENQSHHDEIKRSYVIRYLERVFR